MSQYNNDVHAFSARIRKRMQEDPDFVPEINKLATRSGKNLEQLMLKAFKLTEKHPELCQKYPNASRGLHHMVERHRQMGRNYADPDLNNMPVMRLFCACMNVVLEKREGMLDLWFLHLHDIDEHCLQGDSHRMLQFLTYDLKTKYDSNE